MTTFFIYILKWALCLALLYIPFALLLRKESFATFNRILLVGIIALSAILPSVVVTYPVEVEIIKGIGGIADELTVGESITPATTATSDAPAKKSLLTLGTLVVIYLAGVILTLILRVIEATRILLYIRRGTLWIEKRDGMTIHCHPNDATPFSWFGHMVISQADYDECGTEIILHEEGHYRHGHSWDMLLLSILKALQWFNPFVYMLANDMKEIHEYEADRYVLKHHGNTSAYQLLLLKKAIGDTAFNLANNFSQSCIRKRIIMMARKPSGWLHRGKALSFAPMAGVFLLIFAEPEYIYRIVEDDNTTETIAAPQPVAVTEAVPAPPPIENTPLPLPVQKPRLGKIAKQEIEPLESLPMSEQMQELVEKYEVHANEMYYEYVDLDGIDAGAALRDLDLRKCSIRMQFTAGTDGNANSIKIQECNVSVSGGGDDIMQRIEESKRIAADIAAAHIMSKEWPCTIKDGRSYRTIYDAHMILQFGRAETMSTDSHARPMMIGSYPID